jgi:hypothetical protein
LHPNAALEPGSALGKHTLIIGQNNSVNELFPTLKRPCCARYNPDHREGLKKLIKDKLLSM